MTENRFALREYSGQAPILRLQQLPLRMTEREKIENRDSGADGDARQISGAQQWDYFFGELF